MTEGEFEESLQAALASLPDDLRASMSNVAVVVEDDRPRDCLYSASIRASP